MDCTRQTPFGRLAVELGFVHPDHLRQALVVQRELAGFLDASIEAILVELRYLTRTQAEEVGQAAEALADAHHEARARPAAPR